VTTALQIGAIWDITSKIALDEFAAAAAGVPPWRQHLVLNQCSPGAIGPGAAVTTEEAAVVVFNTCTIREKPDTRLAAYLGNAAARKRERPDLVIAVGGCYAEAQRDRIFERYPFVDVAFGPGSIPHLGDWLGAGGFGVERGRFGSHEHFAADLPMRGESRFQAWVQVSMGCNSACAYRIARRLW